MILRSSRALLLFFGAVLVGLALMLGVLVFQLSRGPISLAFLTPVIARAVESAAGEARVDLHDTVLTWDSEDRSLDIRAVGVRIVDTAGNERATIPELAVRFSAQALTRGLLAPTSFEFFGPRLRVVRTVAGDVRVDYGGAPPGEGDELSGSEIIAELLRPPDPGRPSGYLARIAVRSAFVEFHDLARDVEYVAPRAYLSFERDAQGIAAEGTITLGEGEAAFRFDVSALYRVETGTTEIGIAFDDVATTAVAALDAALAPLAALDTAVGGMIALSLDEDFAIASAEASLYGGPGSATITPLRVEPVPFRALALNGGYDARASRFDLERLSVDLGGPTIDVTGSAIREPEVYRVEAAARVDALPVGAVADYWPADVERTTREWITTNIVDGTVRSATLDAAATIPRAAPAEVDLSRFEGEIVVDGATVHYLRPMEPVYGVAGIVRFDTERVVIDTEGGSVLGLSAESAHIEIDGLSEPSRVETIRIESTVSGPVRDALDLLDSQPLGFIARLGLDREGASGEQRTNLAVAFPLLDKLGMDQIAVAAASRLVDFAAADVAFGLPVSAGDLALSVDRRGLEVDGTAELSGVPVRLSWNERFSDDDPVRSRYEVRGLVDAAQFARFDLDVAPFVAGRVGVDLTYAIRGDGSGVGAVELDLAHSALDAGPLDWHKAAGIPGRGVVGFVTVDGKLTEIPEFRLDAGDLHAEGAAVLRTRNEGLSLAQLSLTRLAFAGTDIFLTADFPEDLPPLLSLGGESLDLRSAIDGMLDEPGTDGGLPAMRVAISESAPLRSVRLGEESHLEGLHGQLIRDEGTWRDVEIRAALAGAGRLYVRIVPEGEHRHLTVESDDAGGLLRALDWVNTIRGGEMRVLGTFLAQDGEDALHGQVDMQNFFLVQGPFVAQFLSLTSLTGIADILRGEGMSFRRAEVPFEMRSSEIVIRNAKARGPDVGILASGRIDRVSDTVDFAGEIAPAYTLNTILANIPLIGQLLAGGGDGIFAATFSASGPIEDPDVSVNPLAALTPGIIRRLLTGFGSEEGAAPPAEEADPGAR